VSEKSTRKAPDYAVESSAARNRSVFRPQLQLCVAILLKSGIICAKQDQKRRFQLKRSRSDRASIEKSCFRTQQTQKSFSTIASGKSLRSAVSANNSARVLAGILATLFKPSSPQFCWQLCKSTLRRTAYPSRVCASPPGLAPLAPSQSRAVQRLPFQDGGAPELRAQTCH